MIYSRIMTEDLGPEALAQKGNLRQPLPYHQLHLWDQLFWFYCISLLQQTLCSSKHSPYFKADWFVPASSPRLESPSFLLHRRNPVHSQHSSPRIPSPAGLQRLPPPLPPSARGNHSPVPTKLYLGTIYTDHILCLV